jgi:hypothetical protein
MAEAFFGTSAKARPSVAMREGPGLNLNVYFSTGRREGFRKIWH